MCTAINSIGSYHCFGRTLDVECAPLTQLAILDKGYTLKLKNGSEIRTQRRIMGSAHLSSGYPLFFDGMNESGLCVAALEFPDCVYTGAREDNSIASFEVIPFVLGNAEGVNDAKRQLEGIKISSENFSQELSATKLHWLIGDRTGSFVLECDTNGVHLYDNPCGVLSNAPGFGFHLARLSEISALSDRPSASSFENEMIKPYSGGFGSLGLPGDYTSSARFLRAAFVEKYCRTYTGAVNRLFTVLDSVKVPYGCVLRESGGYSYTVYTCCMDSQRGEYYYLPYESHSARVFSFSDCTAGGAGLDAFDL